MKKILMGSIGLIALASVSQSIYAADKDKCKINERDTLSVVNNCADVTIQLDC